MHMPHRRGRLARPSVVIVALALAAAACLPALVRSQTLTASRLVVITSDLHLGQGKDPRTGQWLPTEDFRWEEDFAAFLHAVNEAGKGATDLVLNGDTFELWQSVNDDCVAPDATVGCTEAEALARVQRVLAAHAGEMAALGAFARSGANRVTLVPGDHDAALLFPSVATRVLTALHAPDRVEVATRGYWRSADDAIYAEHGHQMPGDPYAFANWPLPFARRGGQARLQRSLGEQLAQRFYNELEPRYPTLDNFAQDGAGLKYLAAANPAALPHDGISPLLAFFLARPTWQDVRTELDGGEIEPPTWDLAAVRRQGAGFFAEALVLDDPFRPLVDQAVKEGALTLDPISRTDRELVALCDYRATIRRHRRRLEHTMTQAATFGRPTSECPRMSATRGSTFDYFWQARDALFAGHSEEIRAALAREAWRTQPITPLAVVVQGHSHLWHPGFVPARHGTAPLVLNSGAWQRTITPFQAEEIMRTDGVSAADLLGRLQPEQLSACYGVVWIDPYAGHPKPRLRFWRSDRQWGVLPRDAAAIGAACPVTLRAGSGGRTQPQQEP